MGRGSRVTRVTGQVTDGSRGSWVIKCVSSQAMVTTSVRFPSTAVRLPFDCNSTGLPSFYFTTYVYLFWAAALRPKGINRSARLRLADYVTVTLMAFDKQSNGRRTAVESQSNRSRNHRLIV